MPVPLPLWKFNMKRMACTVEKTVHNGVVVRHGKDIGEIAYLTGICRPKADLKIGDKGNIEYRVHGSMGAWFWVEK